MFSSLKRIILNLNDVREINLWLKKIVKKIIYFYRVRIFVFGLN